MADIATRTEPPPHLRDLQAQARRLTLQAFEGRDVSVFGDPDIAEHEARIYLALRVQAYQRDMEPWYRMAARELSSLLPLRPAVILEPGGLVTVEPHEAPEKTREALASMAASVRRHYDLEAPDGQDHR